MSNEMSRLDIKNPITLILDLGYSQLACQTVLKITIILDVSICHRCHNIKSEQNGTRKS